MTREQAVCAYNRAEHTELWQAYKNPSARKYRAMDHCKEKQYLLNGYDGRITAAGCQFFSYAFRYMEDGIEKLRYITYANDYDYNYSLVTV